ncbi:MAG TPA: glutaredoxin family protein [Actinomycetota bacterium]|nr:glutaredoxin family protein [Actinomycetota bacterium]
MRTVVLYTRPGCHLCDDARASIETVRDRVPFAFTEIDIGSDDDLVRDYGIRIPVVTIDGEERFEISVDPDELTAALTEPAPR